MVELDPLEQADFIAYEERELDLRFAEQVNLIQATSSSKEEAKARIDILASTYWVEFEANNEDRDMLDTEALMKLQQKTFVMTDTGRGAVLEIK